MVCCSAKNDPAQLLPRYVEQGRNHVAVGVAKQNVGLAVTVEITADDHAGNHTNGRSLGKRAVSRAIEHADTHHSDLSATIRRGDIQSAVSVEIRDHGATEDIPRAIGEAENLRRLESTVAIAQ